MNLPQALLIDRQQRAARLDDLIARWSGYDAERYFHDCLPGCQPGSPRVEDHVPLPGNPTPTCRVLYRKALRFFRAGAPSAEAPEGHRERVFLAANRIGKTQAAAFEVRCHMTGLYPPWWEGRRFDGPTLWWAAGDTRQTTRDIIQTSLMGPHQGVPTATWRGMLDPRLITNVVRASGGVANCLDTIYVQHVAREHGAPMTSELGFKSYDQGRRVFQGDKRHGIWLDEEPPDGGEAAEAEAQGSSDIWTECLLRTMTTDGIVMATFTPLRGYTPFLKQYVETAVMPSTEDEAVSVDARSNFFPDILAA
jgi:phage terminase large subunit-like protein